MQAFIDASNEFAESHPELVSSYDAEGNALIMLEAALNAVAAARKKASESAEDAAEKEIEAAETARDEAVEKVSTIDFTSSTYV